MTFTPRARKAMSLLAALLVTAGVVAISYPFATNLYTAYHQRSLRDAWEAMRKRPSTAPRPAPARQTRRETAERIFGSLRISKLRVSSIVLVGTGRANLRLGPCWYESSAPPGRGNTAIAAHRTTYGAWFRALDRLAAGDLIELETTAGTFTYRVEKVFSVDPHRWDVVEDCGYPALTLTTCDPPGSATRRLVVRARLVSRRERRTPAE